MDLVKGALYTVPQESDMGYLMDYGKFESFMIVGDSEVKFWLSDGGSVIVDVAYIYTLKKLVDKGKYHIVFTDVNADEFEAMLTG